jgi:3-deoxy-D-manno-octulosonic-acid transferase
LITNRIRHWFHYLDQIKTQNIPLYLINGVFSRSYHAFYALYLKNCLSCFKQIFVINESSKKHLEVLGFSSRILADTRYDRMQEIVKTEFIDLKIEQFINRHQTIVCGSTWYKDELLIREIIFKFPNVKWILVPHEVHSKRIEEIRNLFKNASFYSKEINNHSNVLVIDSIGMLSKVYRYADICYVGGGFNKVVHSILEPLSYIKPVFSGPNIAKSEEALSYQKMGFLETINSASELETKLSDYLNKTQPEKQNETQEFIQSQLGSTEVFLELVEEE